MKKDKTVTKIWNDLIEAENKHLSHDNWTDDDMCEILQWVRSNYKITTHLFSDTHWIANNCDYPLYVKEQLLQLFIAHKSKS